MTEEELNGIGEAIAAFKAGEIVVVTDDDDRENEGDLFVSASNCTPEKMAFIVRHTSGIVCAPMTSTIAAKFRLDPMVSMNDAPLHTAFTVSVDFRHGLTTGISAEERTATVRALANDNAGPADFVRPGHVFPLVARDGGVLIRSGHTEACVDLCRMAGLPEVGVLAELVNDDGTVMRGAQVTAFAAEHGLKTLSVADLISYRRRSEQLVEQLERFALETPEGVAEAIVYTTPYDAMHHIALIFGEIGDGTGILVRLHPENLADDLFGKSRRVDRVMKRIASEGRGIIVYLREGSVGVAGSASRARDALGDEEHSSAKARDAEWREIGLGAQILRDLGVRSIRLLSSRERRYVGVGGFGIEIEDTEILES